MGYYNTGDISATDFLGEILPMKLHAAVVSDEAQPLLLLTSNRNEAYSLMDRIADACEEYEANGFEGVPVTYMPLLPHADDKLKVRGSDTADEYVVEINRRLFYMNKEEMLNYQENRLHPEWLFQRSLPQGGVGLALFRYGLEPYDDITIDHPQYRRFLDPLKDDRSKYYPHWCVIGVIEQDNPDCSRLLRILKHPMCFTVLNETV